MQIKPTLRFHSTPVRMAKANSTTDIQYWRGCAQIVFQFLSVYPSCRSLLKIENHPISPC